MAQSFYGDSNGINPAFLSALIQAAQGRRSADLQRQSLQLQKDQMRPGHILVNSLLQGLAQAPGQALGSIPGQLIAGGQAAERQASDQTFQSGQADLQRAFLEKQGKINNASAIQGRFASGVAEGNLIPIPGANGQFSYIPVQPIRDQYNRAFQKKMEDARYQHELDLRNVPQAQSKDATTINPERVNQALQYFSSYQDPFTQTSPNIQDLNPDEARMVQGMSTAGMRQATGMDANQKALEGKLAQVEATLKKNQEDSHYKDLLLSSKALDRQSREAIARASNETEKTKARNFFEAKKASMKVQIDQYETQNYSPERKAIRDFVNTLDWQENTVEGQPNYQNNDPAKKAQIRTQIIGLNQKAQAAKASGNVAEYATIMEQIRNLGTQLK